jgi:hypothetical protein
VGLAEFIYFAALPLLMVSAGPAKKLKENKQNATEGMNIWNKFINPIVQKKTVRK